MPEESKAVVGHLANNASITQLGAFLHNTKSDELAPLINVLPGITGLAQVNNIDISTPKLLAQTDKRMVDNLTLMTYFKDIIQTATSSGSGYAVK